MPAVQLKAMLIVLCKVDDNASILLLHIRILIGTLDGEEPVGLQALQVKVLVVMKTMTYCGM